MFSLESKIIKIQKQISFLKKQYDCIREKGCLCFTETPELNFDSLQRLLTGKFANGEEASVVIPIGELNLSYTPSSTQGIIVSDNGTDAVIPLVGVINAGLMSPTMFGLLNNALQNVITSNSIQLLINSNTITANLKISNNQGENFSLTIETDGLKVQETIPNSYNSKASATVALGVGKKFRYTIDNIDGAVENSIAWT